MPVRLGRRVAAIARDEGMADALRSGWRVAHVRLRRTARRTKWSLQYHPRSVPDVRRVYDLDPERIDYAIWQSDLKAHFGGKPSYAVLDGDWDLLKVAFEGTYIYRGLFERFVEGADWEETEYHAVVERDRPEDPIEYLSQYDEMFADMRENGFREGNEIVVHIGRNGEYIRFNGFHRLSMAKILGLESIPARVSLRHREWQLIRDAVARAGSVSELPEEVREHVSHPDLRELH